jgi:hypothetical protein
MNIDDIAKMTTQERRDWLARDEGWTCDTSDPCLAWTHPTDENGTGGHYWVGSWYGEHPIPDTLDAAAKALPDGWRWTKSWGWSKGLCCLTYSAYVDGYHVVVADTGDEKHDRFGLAIAARMAMKKGAHP